MLKNKPFARFHSTAPKDDHSGAPNSDKKSNPIHNPAPQEQDQAQAEQAQVEQTPVEKASAKPWMERIEPYLRLARV